MQERRNLALKALTVEAGAILSLASPEDIKSAIESLKKNIELKARLVAGDGEYKDHFNAQLLSITADVMANITPDGFIANEAGAEQGQQGTVNNGSSADAALRQIIDEIRPLAVGG